jgi:DNA-binding NarL/FixJ family response regulator
LPPYRRSRSQPSRVAGAPHPEQNDPLPADGAGPTGTLPPAPEVLSPIELEVLVRVAAGIRTVDIAAELRRSPKTIEKHRTHILLKLALHNVAQVAVYAVYHGLVDAETVLRDRTPRAR